MERAKCLGSPDFNNGGFIFSRKLKIKPTHKASALSDGVGVRLTKKPCFQGYMMYNMVLAALWRTKCLTDNSTLCLTPGSAQQTFSSWLSGVIAS